MPIIEDVASSHACRNKVTRTTEAFLRNHEWHYISMDATLKLFMKIMHQAPYRAVMEVRDDAPFGDAVAWRRLLTVRGRTGAVLFMYPLQNETIQSKL